MNRLALLTLAILLAGCAGPEAALPPDAPAADGPGQRAEVPSADAEAATSGRPDPARFRMEGEFYARLMLPGVCERDLTVGCSAYAHEVSNVAFRPAWGRSQAENASFREWVFTAAWTPTQPTAAAVYMRIVDEATETVLGVVKGTSPLEAPVPRERMSGAGSYRVTIAPTEGGAFHDQSVTVVLGVR